MASRSVAHLALAGALSLLFLACGGGGASSGDDGSDTTLPFQLLTISPPSGSQEVPNDYSVSATFSAALDGTSVRLTSFYVTEQGGTTAQSGSFRFSGDLRTVYFEADPWYETETDYVLHLTTAVRSQGGEPLATPATARFRTSSWPTPGSVTSDQFRELETSGETMIYRRARHTSTLLPKANVLPSDYVLLTGGYTTANTTTASAELFDVSREMFFQTSAMSEQRANHTATFLPDGSVLVAGGEKRIGEVNRSADLFFPASATFVASGPMIEGRSDQTATLLQNGKVLVTGGKSYDSEGYLDPLTTGEIYDPVSRTWSPVLNGMSIWRYGHQATLLPSGEVMITGGGFWEEHRVADIYDPVHNRFERAVNLAASARWEHGALVLPSGRLFLTDGGEQKGELFTPLPSAQAGIFETIASGDSLQRYAAVTFEFRPGEILILGGFEILGSGDWFLHASMEHYVENYGALGKYFQVPTIPPDGIYLKDPRAFSAVSRLPKREGEEFHRFLITGGLGNEDLNLRTALLFDPNHD